MQQIHPAAQTDDGLASTFEALHANRWHPAIGPSACGVGISLSAFPEALALEQLRKLRRRQAHCSVEQAHNKNSKNLVRAGKFPLGGVAETATRRIPFSILGRGCADMRSRVADGWVPGLPFATHGEVGANAQCTPTAMREWIAAVPGAWVVALPDPTAKFACLAPLLPVSPHDCGILDVIPDADRIARLTPASATDLATPSWLAIFASAASAGETFWA